MWRGRGFTAPLPQENARLRDRTILLEPAARDAATDGRAQAAALAPLDRETLNLLAGHAATAIVSSRLYADAERTRHTLESFRELSKAR